MTAMANRILLMVLLLVSGSGLAKAPSQTWAFDVYLDDTKIGFHRFELVADGDRERVTSNAQFDVRFLFVNAFKYRHRNQEVWSNDCLQTIDADTRINRKRSVVTGEQGSGEFVVAIGDEQRQYEECVMTFAYWNSEFLSQSRLLNPQSGDYLDVTVEELPAEEIIVRGEAVAARPYRLQAEDMEIKVWYSSGDEWLALESAAKGGRMIRYELI